MWLSACAADPVDLDPELVGRDSATETLPSDSATETIAGFDCDPEAEPAYVVEGEAASLRFSCGTGVEASFEMVSGPEGSSLDSSGRFAWTPGLADAGRVEVEVRARDEAGGVDLGEGTVWVADAWSAPGNVEVDPTLYTEEWGLPVLHLHIPPDINSTTNVPTKAVWRGVEHDIEVQYRGAASLYYPKKSYKLAFASDDEFEDEETDYPRRHDVVLTTLFDDPSYIRQKLTFDTWNALGPERRQVETRFVVLYTDGDYVGLYLLGDHIDKEWWEDQGFTEYGNLYKSVDHSASWYYDYATGWEKKDGEPLDDFSDLEELLSWVVHSGDEDFAAGLDQRLPVADVADWWVMCVGAWIDDSCGKNAYLYHDEATDDLFRHVPWDFNASWGQEWETTKTSSDVDYDFGDTNNLFERSLELDELRDALLGDLEASLAGEMSAEVQNGRIDAYLELVGPSVPRDWEKWSADFEGYFGWGDLPQTPDEELAYVRTWIEERNLVLSTRY